MNQNKKATGCGITTILWGAVILGGIIIGFFFLMRGCLSRWDSYGVVGWPGISEDETSMVIVKSYNQTTSYSRNGGFVRKSYSTTYYLEKIDLITGKVIKKTKLISQRKLKNGPLDCYGGYKNKLWVFASTLRAYDMNTLEQVVKLEDIENKNPELKGKLPVERTYYNAHLNLGYITITALDGDKYNIMLDDLHAELVEDTKATFDEFNADIKNQKNAIQAKFDSLDQVARGKDYYKMYELQYKYRQQLYASRDSLNVVEENAKDVFDYNREVLEDIEEFDSFFSGDIRKWCTSRDTMDGYGFLLLNEKPTGDYFDLRNFNYMGSESDKASIYKMKLEMNPKAHSSYDRIKVVSTETFKERYLQGGIMVNYKTARAYQTIDPSGYIIFSRNIIGKDGKLMVSRVDTNGKQLWQTNTLMDFELVFTVATKAHLIVVGYNDLDNKPAFSGADGLRIIDLKTGSFIEVKY